MYISADDWKKYIDRLSAINEKAGALMKKYIERHGLEDTKALIDYAYLIATVYSEASAALSAAMYDAIAEVSGKYLPAAEMAATPEYGEVAKAINGTIKQSSNAELISSSISRLVKRTGADTTLLNAQRDGAQFAWIPSGDTCAFCIAIASRGWQYVSKTLLRNGHAEHIHGNCDCTYAIRFDSNSGVRGYDPEVYEEMYYDADGRTPQDRINSMRRKFYAENKEKINAQKRSAYEKSKELESSAAEEVDV